MSYYRMVAPVLMSATLLWCAGSILVADGAQAETVALPTTAIPLKNTEDPAIDLLFDGKPLDPDKAADLRKSGTDLSLLQPSPNDVWSNTKLSAVDQAPLFYPAAGEILEHKATLRLNADQSLQLQVQAVGSDGTTRLYRVVLSLEVHEGMMRAALLRKLGYPVRSPRWYKQATVRFADVKEREAFIDSLSVAAKASHKRWVLSTDETKNELVLQDVMLEPSTMIVPTNWYMGSMLPTQIKGRRTMRSLIVPFTFLDVPEAVNMYSSEPSQVIDEKIILMHRHASAFSETTYDDARWITERIGRLSRADFKEIVDAGQYPPDIAAIIYEKTLARRNNLVAQFDVRKRIEEPKFPFDLKITVGSVDQGKVTREHYDGYALRFTHGDPKSPLQTDDIVRFIKIETISALIHQLTAMVNYQLEVFPMDKLLKERGETLYQAFIKYINSKPTEPYVQPLSTWGGPVGGVSINASRSIVTGSYYGEQQSDFKVSLVDQISAGVRIGYFLGIDGYPNVVPAFGANVSVVRSYVHVRPIPSMQAASKEGWDQLWVPGFMKGLGETLKVSQAEKPTDQLAEMNKGVEKFLEDLKENESFTISDTLTLGANATLTIPLTTLLGIAPVSYAAMINIGATGKQVVLRRTTFTRENGLIKIYLQNVESQLASVQLDFYLWMNVMRLSSQYKWGEAQTRAFHLDEKPTETKKLRNSILAIRGILEGNNSELLEENFNPYELKHKTGTDTSNGNFLFWQWTNIEEWHRVKVRPPKDVEKGIEDTEKYERTLFSHRILKRSGKNYYAFLGDVLDAVVQNSTFWKPGMLSGGGGSNPKDSFYGSARWTVTNTEAEVTKGNESNPVTMVQQFWAGWDLSKADLFKIIDGIDNRVKGLELALPLIDRNVFNDMLRLQLYEISTTFIVYEAGVENLRTKFLKKSGVKAGFLKTIEGWDDYSGGDAEIVANILIPLYGQARFDDYCLAQRMSGGETMGVDKGGAYRGVKYKCLMPWMWEILSMRRKYPEDREEQIKWTTRFINLLQRNVELSALIKFLGKSNVYFQAKISGFRTRDENGDTADYTSSTIGTFNSKDKAGVFRDFVTDYKIMSSEMNATYLSEGY